MAPVDANPDMAPDPAPDSDARSDRRTRVIEASVDEVFAALCDPVRLARWWGPEGFTSSVNVFEFCPGGSWRLTLHGPDGSDYPNEYRVLGLEPNRRVELDHPSNDHHFTLRIELEPRGRDTVVLWRQTLDSVEAYQGLADFLAQANEQVLARLSAEVMRLRG
jgi:uncharacterized protein YndB with AHSA1/START domain